MWHKKIPTNYQNQSVQIPRTKPSRPLTIFEKKFILSPAPLTKGCVQHKVESLLSDIALSALERSSRTLRNQFLLHCFALHICKSPDNALGPAIWFVFRCTLTTTWHIWFVMIIFVNSLFPCFLSAVLFELTSEVRHQT